MRAARAHEAPPDSSECHCGEGSAGRAWENLPFHVDCSQADWITVEPVRQVSFVVSRMLSMLCLFMCWMSPEIRLKRG